MQRIFLALALMALAAAASAQSTSASSGIPDNVHSGMTSKPHPAANAHANSVAGQSSAARMEACQHLSGNFLDELEKGDFGTASANFNAQMKAVVSTDKLGQLWQSLGSQFGRLESRGDAQTVMYQDMPVVSTPLHFTKSNFVSQLACDTEGKIAGFYIRPMQAAPAAASSAP